ncbi:hypothetical protein ACIPW5_38695 [Streptomyces sp. NPDC090077]|uniref:hypothetical protein n=1 Tax=Streptomyces sp. NPDC090077 TaxID=3365938 RepID=UPI0037F1D3C9
MVKIAFTALWAGVVVLVNWVLDGSMWGQYLATFLLAGIYAFTLGKVDSLRGKKVDEMSK